MVGRRRPTRRARGATLAEMLVVIALFSLLLTLILGFYIEGEKVTRRQDLYSASYRRVVGLLERMETLLAGSRVFRVEADQVVFAPLPEGNPIQGGWPAWPSQANTLFIQPADPATGRPQRLVLLAGGTTADLVELAPWDRLSFSADLATGVFYVTAVSTPPLEGGRQEGVARTLQLTRHILLENAESW